MHLHAPRRTHTHRRHARYKPKAKDGPTFTKETFYGKYHRDRVAHEYPVPGSALKLDDERIKRRENRFEDIDARVQDIRKRHEHRADIRGKKERFILRVETKRRLNDIEKKVGFQLDLHEAHLAKEEEDADTGHANTIATVCADTGVTRRTSLSMGTGLDFHQKRNFIENVRNNNHKEVSYALKTQGISMANAAERTAIGNTTTMGHTPLHIAVAKGYPNLVEVNLNRTCPSVPPKN
jgi:hypothetical protein